MAAGQEQVAPDQREGLLRMAGTEAEQWFKIMAPEKFTIIA